MVLKSLVVLYPAMCERYWIWWNVDYMNKSCMWSCGINVREVFVCTFLFSRNLYCMYCVCVCVFSFANCSDDLDLFHSFLLGVSNYKF